VINNYGPLVQRFENELEMYRTFKRGVRMMVCVSEEDKDITINSLKSSGKTA